MAKRLIKFIPINESSSYQQLGFTKYLSTSDAVIDFLNTFHKSLREEQNILDLCKACAVHCCKI